MTDQTASRTASDPDLDRRRSLRRHRLVATGLLLLMALIFVACRSVPEPGFWVRLIEAGAEAAMVGGLADWFAVVAMFRHPLGVPIPHTAVIPRNKDRIGEGLGGFVEQHILAPELVAGKLRSLDLASRLAGWLAQPRFAAAVADRAVAVLPYLVTSLDDPQIRDFIRRALEKQLRSVDLAPLLGRVLAVLVESGQHELLYDRAVAVALRFLEENADRFYEKVNERSAWWIPRTINRQIARALVEGLRDSLTEFAEPDSEARQTFQAAVVSIIDKLQHAPDYQAKVAALRDQVLLSDAVQGALDSVWDELRRIIVTDAEARSSTLRRMLAEGLQSVGRTLAADPAMQARLNRRFERVTVKVVVPWRAEIGRFIAEVVRSWDARTVSDRLELAVGRDLQYIRINGTVVGACVGCILFLLTWLAG